MLIEQNYTNTTGSGGREGVGLLKNTVIYKSNEKVR